MWQSRKQLTKINPQPDLEEQTKDQQTCSESSDFQILQAALIYTKAISHEAKVEELSGRRNIVYSRQVAASGEETCC